MFAFILYHRYPDFVGVIDEDGNVVYDFNNTNLKEFTLIKAGISYKLLATDDNNNKTSYIYSLPGNGRTQAATSPSSSKHSARKIARDGQVLVKTETNTYTLQGQLVK